VRASVEAGIAAAQASARLQGEAASAAEKYLEEQVQDLRNHNLIATSDVRTGAVVPELLAALREGDLVVVTTRERGGLARWALGSVADEFVRHAPGPVMLVRPSRTASTAQQGEDQENLIPASAAESA
jgi:nucleotide-binding universal stress UspA family protein